MCFHIYPNLGRIHRIPIFTSHYFKDFLNHQKNAIYCDFQHFTGKMVVPLGSIINPIYTLFLVCIHWVYSPFFLNVLDSELPKKHTTVAPEVAFECLYLISRDLFWLESRSFFGAVHFFIFFFEYADSILKIYLLCVYIICLIHTSIYQICILFLYAFAFCF